VLEHQKLILSNLKQSLKDWKTANRVEDRS